MINDFVVATGQGPAEAHPKMADPLRSETYGLASSTSFHPSTSLFCQPCGPCVDNTSRQHGHDKIDGNNITGLNISKMEFCSPRRHYTNSPQAAKYTSRYIFTRQSASR
jgi:hypothetical protein